MSDLYQEILVKRDTPTVNKVLKAGLIAVVVLLVAASIFISPFLMLAAVVVGALAFAFVIPKLDVEYEYLYVNGELDIDVIYSRQKRKKLGSYAVTDLEVLAPANSHALDNYRKEKLMDYTSGKNTGKEYIAVYNKDKKRDVLKLELNEAILKDMQRVAPRKINLY